MVRDCCAWCHASCALSGGAANIPCLPCTQVLLLLMYFPFAAGSQGAGVQGGQGRCGPGRQQGQEEGAVAGLLLVDITLPGRSPAGD